MGFCNNWPYTNLHELNLDWIIEQINILNGEIESEIYQYKFADPIEWNIERSYPVRTIVYYNGDSYASLQYVPIGTPITDGDYWLKVFDYNAQYDVLEKEIKDRMLALEMQIQDAKPKPPEIPYENTRQTNETVEYRNGKPIIINYPFNAGQGGSASTSNPMPLLITAASYLSTDAQNSLTYGHVTALDVASFADRRFIDPRQHKNADGKMDIDCSAFAQLCALGVVWAISGYKVGQNAVRGLCYNPFSPAAEAYAKHEGEPQHGRMLSARFAEFLRDRGELLDIINSNQIRAGMILFTRTGEDIQSVGHCAICVGNYSGKVVIIDVTDYGLGVRVMKDSELNRTKYAWIPPVPEHNINSPVRGGHSGSVEANGSATFTRPYMGALKVYCTTQSSVTITATFTASDSTAETVSISTTVPANGCLNFIYMPNWNIQVESSAAATFKYYDEPWSFDGNTPF